MGITDKYASGYEHMVTRLDPGNVLGPPHAGNATHIMESQHALNTRQQKCYSGLIKHLAFNEEFKDKCMEDMQNPRFVIAAGMPNAGQADMSLFVPYIQELWEQLYDSSDRPIKDQPATQQNPGLTNRLDGMSSEIQLEEQMDPMPEAFSFPASGFRSIPSLTGVVGATANHAFSTIFSWALAAMTVAGGDAFLKEERDCWNCKGWGHTKEECRSAKRARPLSACIRGLQEKMTREQGRLKNARAGGRRFIRRRGVPGGDRRRAPPGDNPSAYYVYDDGSIYNAEGSLVTLSADFTPDELCSACEANPAGVEVQPPSDVSRDGVFDGNVVVTPPSWLPAPPAAKPAVETRTVTEYPSARIVPTVPSRRSGTS